MLWAAYSSMALGFMWASRWMGVGWLAPERSRYSRASWESAAKPCSSPWGFWRKSRNTRRPREVSRWTSKSTKEEPSTFWVSKGHW